MKLSHYTLVAINTLHSINVVNILYHGTEFRSIGSFSSKQVDKYLKNKSGSMTEVPLTTPEASNTPASVTFHETRMDSNDCIEPMADILERMS